MKTDLSQSCGHCWVFQICWHIECSTFIASSFRIWNSSTGIPSPPLALFIMMLSKFHLTSHSRISGSRWVITPSWLSGSWRTFLHSSVYSCHIFLISSASVTSILFLSFIVPVFLSFILHLVAASLRRGVTLSLNFMKSVKQKYLFSPHNLVYRISLVISGKSFFKLIHQEFLFSTGINSYLSG